MTKIGVPQVFGKNLFNFICYLLFLNNDDGIHGGRLYLFQIV